MGMWGGGRGWGDLVLVSLEKTGSSLGRQAQGGPSCIC